MTGLPCSRPFHPWCAETPGDHPCPMPRRLPDIRLPAPPSARLTLSLPAPHMSSLLMRPEDSAASTKNSSAALEKLSDLELHFSGFGHPSEAGWLSREPASAGNSQRARSGSSVQDIL